MLSYFILTFRAYIWEMCISMIEFQKYSQFHALYLLSILLMCGGSLHTLYFSSAPIDKNYKPRTLEELKASIRREVDSISEIELIRVNAHLLKRCQKCEDEAEQHLMLQARLRIKCPTFRFRLVHLML